MANADEFIIKMNDQVSGPASAATDALNKLQSQVSGAESALGSVGAAASVAGINLRGLNGQFISKEALAAMAQAIPGFEALSEGAKKAALAESALGGASDGASEKLNKQLAKDSAAYDKFVAKMTSQAEKVAKQNSKDAAAKVKLDEKMLTQSEKLAAEDANAAANNSFEGKIKGMIGAAEHATGVTGKLTAALRSLGPEGAAIAAALTAVIAVVGAVVVAFTDLAAAAISISQEKDALAATFKALSTGSESGKELVDSLSEVAAALPFAEGKVLAWGKSLMSAGIEGEGLAVAVKAAAAATALMGDEGGAAVINMEKQLAAGGAAANSLIKVVKEGGKKAAVQLSAMGLQADDLARALGVTPEKMKTMALTAEQLSAAMEKALIEKGAGALETMGLTWDSIKGKLGDGIEDLFEDLGSAVQPFMAEVKSLFSEFLAGSTTMSTAKDVITAVLTDVFSAATKVVNFLHKGFLMVEIAAFKVLAALWPLISVIVAIATNATVLDGIIVTLKIIAVIAAAVIAPFALLSVIFFAVGAAIWAMVAAIVAALAWCVGDAARATGEMIDSLTGWATAAYDAAANFVSGIVDGISNGVGAVVSAVKALASSAMSAFTGFFKIHSPSQLMADTAIHIPGGAVEGIETGTGDVADAMQDMGDAGMGGAAKGFGKGGAKKFGGGDVYNVNVQYSGTREDFQHFKTLLSDALEEARGLAPRTA